MNPNTSFTRNSARLRTKARIIWAIAWKDIVEAIKNKNTLAVLLTAIPMIFVYYYLPALGARGEPPLVRVYDAGDSVLVARLENSDVLELRTYTSEAQMKEALTSSDVPAIAITIPGGFDQTLEVGGGGQLQGYVLNWVGQADADELRQTVEDEIAFQLGQPMPIVLQDRVYLTPDSHGIGTSAGISWVFVLTMVGLTLIPHLMLEEKKTRTIEVLMISPAGSGSLIAGKAIAGLFYCLLGAGVALVFYRWLVIHWWLALLVTVLGALFTISFGLMLGSIIESRAQLTMWAWVFIIPLFLPVFLSLMEGLVPDRAIEVFRLVPTAVIMDLLRASFAATFPLGAVLLKLFWLTAWTAGVLALDVWIVRRQDRQPAKAQPVAPIEKSSATPILDAAVRWLASLSGRFSRPQALAAAGPVGRTAVQVGDRAAQAGKRDGWRIILTIASKDITGMLKNKLVLSIMFGTAFIMASNAALPLLLRLRDTPAIVVYDEGRSTILRALTASDDLRLGITNSLEEMQDVVSGSPEVVLGLVATADFDRQAGSADLIELDGYVVHWADPEDVVQRVAFFEEQLGTSTWGQVQIHVSEQLLYPTGELEGQRFMFALTFAIVLFTMGIALVPLLFVEERQAHTLEVLLVSPARISEVVIGKALAGAVYCLLAAGVVFLFNQYLVVHWGVALLAALLGAALAVAIGLLVGIISDSPTTVGLWGSLIILVMLALTLVGSYAGIDWPVFIDILFEYLPTSALVEMFGFSLAGEIPLLQVWANSAALLAAVLLVLGLVGWRLRLTDR
jgi:ABC-2 type transport system permease protein